MHRAGVPVDALAAAREDLEVAAQSVGVREAAAHDVVERKREIERAIGRDDDRSWLGNRDERLVRDVWLVRGAEQVVCEVRRLVIRERAEHARVATERVRAIAERPHGGPVARDDRRHDREQEVVGYAIREGRHRVDHRRELRDDLCANRRAHRRESRTATDRVLAGAHPPGQRRDPQRRAEPSADFGVSAGAATIADDHSCHPVADPGRHRVLAVAAGPTVPRSGHRRAGDCDSVHMTLLIVSTEHDVKEAGASLPHGDLTVENYRCLGGLDR